MKYEVEKDTCIGCGLCTQLASNNFDLDDDGKAQVISQPNENEIEEAESALDSCPVNAIHKE